MTTIGSTAPAVPMPTPIATVVSRIAATPGRAGRSRPNATIPSMHSAMALRGPIRPLTHGPIGANRPMSSTGIVVSRPTTPNDTPRSAWICGSNGPMPTSCGRMASVPRNSPESTARVARLDMPSREGSSGMGEGYRLAAGPASSSVQPDFEASVGAP